MKKEKTKIARTNESEVTPWQNKRIKNENLKYQERIAASNEISFWTFGACLKTIRDDKLYENEGYKSFDAYLRDRWKYTEAHANVLFEAIDIRSELICAEPRGRYDSYRLPTDFTFFYMLSKLNVADRYFCLDALKGTFTINALRTLLNEYKKI